MDPRLMVELTALIAAVGTLLTVFLKSRKVNSDVQLARDRRNSSLEDLIYRRLQKEIVRQDGQINDLRKRWDDCEKKHDQAVEEIEKLKAARQARDQRMAVIEEKVHVIEDRAIRPEDVR
jgi:peptidoglycan hydrolase CwlO-like protein